MKKLGIVLDYLNPDTESITFYDGSILRKATLDEIDKVKLHLDPLLKSVDMMSIFEHTRNIKDGVQVASYIEDKTKWNYWVVDFSDNIYAYKRIFPFYLANPQLKIGYILSVDKKRFGLKSFKWSYIILNQMIHYGVIDIDRKFIEFVNTVQKSLSVFDKEEYPFISRALEDYIDLNMIPMSTYFRVIGQFAILENLLTEPGNRSNTINGQLQSKINLLNNRFHNRLEILSYIKGPDNLTLEKVIEKLYTFRSNIAHGNGLDNPKTEILSYPSKTRGLIRDILSRVILQSLIEPSLIRDLRKC